MEGKTAQSECIVHKSTVENILRLENAINWPMREKQANSKRF